MRRFPSTLQIVKYPIWVLCFATIMIVGNRLTNLDEDPYDTIKKQQELQDPKYKKGMHDREWREQHGFEPIYYPENNY